MDKIMERENCMNMCGKSNKELLCGHDISCFSKIAGTLTGEEIERHGLIIREDNTPQNCLQATSFDLTLGEGHYIYKGGNSGKGKKSWELIFIGTDERLYELNKQSPGSEKYNRNGTNKPKTLFIPAFGSAFVQLNETVDTYTVAEQKNLLIVGRFDLKLSNVHQGLISQQATQVEPCYKGKLFCFIHNLSNKEIQLEYGQKMATIEFSYVSCFCNEEKRMEIIHKLIVKSRDKYNASKSFCDDKGIKEVRHFRAEQKLPDDCGLLGFKEKMIKVVKSGKVIDEIAEKVEKKVEVKSRLHIPIIVAVITLVGTVIGHILTLSGMKGTQEKQQLIMEDLEQKIEELEDNLDATISVRQYEGQSID